MALQLERDRHAGDVVPLAGLEPHELDVGAERVEVDRERRLLLLPAQRRLEMLVAAVDDHAVAGNVGRREERQPHDVVPVHVRQEHVVGAAAPPLRASADCPNGRTPVPRSQTT